MRGEGRHRDRRRSSSRPDLNLQPDRTDFAAYPGKAVFEDGRFDSRLYVANSGIDS